MPKLGMEPVRRTALVKATIAEIGVAGNLDVTVSKIAKRAGMSAGLAHHYFGGKEQIFLAAMRYTLTLYGQEVRSSLAGARGPRERLDAIIRAGFADSNFQPEAIAAWLNFYVLAQTSPEARHLLSVYRRRLRSNLLHELRPLVGERAEAAAVRLAGMIDGLYLRQALAQTAQPSEDAVAHVLHVLDAELKERPQ